MVCINKGKNTHSINPFGDPSKFKPLFAISKEKQAPNLSDNHTLTFLFKDHLSYYFNASITP